ncbi:MAG: hypothetical protein QOJ02_537 [Acidobacteriota bacterium]|jgi:hypothetical protein|nr:hypothetical protein [Acidobacteriota bacterium]
MPRSSGKKRAGATGKSDTPASPSLDPLKTGMPALDSITDVQETRVGKKVYHIIETNEMDEYDKPEAPKKKRSRKR